MQVHYSESYYKEILLHSFEYVFSFYLAIFQYYESMNTTLKLGHCSIVSSKKVCGINDLILYYRT